MTTIRDQLDYTPQDFAFGTSGRRGLVVHLSQLEIYINALAELQYLQSLPESAGGIRPGQDFYYARDLRPSSDSFVPEQGGRGEIAQAIEQAIRDAGMTPVNLGQIPTPALTAFALSQSCGSIMITGSHIPFDRNGYKTNSANGELLKHDEAPINAQVAQVRRTLYATPADQSPFNARGQFTTGHRPLAPESPAARQAYIDRYINFFPENALAGLRLLAYQHSAVGRDLLVEILRRLGATVFPAGRSEVFIPIDTEAIDPAQLATISDLAADIWQKHGPIDAVVSTDGDSDRPLLLAAAGSPAGFRNVRFFGGDLVGMVVAEYLNADAIVVPISCNDAIDRGPLRDRLQPRTRIGSPYVIAGMQTARDKGAQAICGWEANGGFLTGSTIQRNGKSLAPLPTRDAMLPILATLHAAVERKTCVAALFDRLPARYSKAALLRQFPRPVSLRIVARYSPADPAIKDVRFGPSPAAFDESGKQMEISDPVRNHLSQIRLSLSEYFNATQGFGAIERLNYIDGVRIFFSNGDVAHIRPSGNADELRIYAVADTQSRADAITAAGIAEPSGILRRLEASS